jgi:hypothetical protein
MHKARNVPPCFPVAHNQQEPQSLHISSYCFQCELELKAKNLKAVSMFLKNPEEEPFVRSISNPTFRGSHSPEAAGG